MTKITTFTAMLLLLSGLSAGLELTSPDFDHGEAIPMLHTCQRSDVNPELSWSKVPNGTQSLALIVDDPDAPDPKNPQMTWVHWVVFNLPAKSSSLSSSLKGKDLPEGARAGKNDWGTPDYGGPCPPLGQHRYFHKLYALDTTLELDRPTKAELLKAMEGHVLAKTELVGTYEKR